MRKLFSISLTAIALGFGLQVAHADNTAITITDSFDGNNGSYSLGFQFSPTTNIDVTSLGSFFGSGATDQQGISIWDSNNNLVVSATVTGDGDPTEGFQFTSIPTTELFAGDTYTIGGATNGDVYAITSGGSPGQGFNLGPGVNYLAHVESGCDGPDACFPANNYGTEFADFGPNFTYTGGGNSPVPEPSTFLMLGSGLAGLGGMLRRKFARG